MIQVEYSAISDNPILFRILAAIYITCSCWHKLSVLNYQPRYTKSIDKGNTLNIYITYSNVVIIHIVKILLTKIYLFFFKYLIYKYLIYNFLFDNLTFLNYFFNYVILH